MSSVDNRKVKKMSGEFRLRLEKVAPSYAKLETYEEVERKLRFDGLEFNLSCYLSPTTCFVKLVLPPGWSEKLKIPCDVVMYAPEDSHLTEWRAYQTRLLSIFTTLKKLYVEFLDSLDEILDLCD